MQTTLVLLPGMDGTGRLFAPLLRALPDRLRAVVVGYPTDRVLTYDGLLPLVQTALPPDGPCILLGESYSGPLALMAATRNPGSIRGVILCASFIASPLPAAVSCFRFLIGPHTVQLVPWPLRRKIILSRNGSDGTRALLASIRGSVSPAVMAARAREILALDCADALKNCPAPILYLAATNDALVGRRSRAQILKARPDVTVATIEGPHLVLQESPGEAARAIVNFIEICTERS
jgi:pimeloyl-ACP methyl ester carboxylesterase